ncbi:Mg-chelatase subunit ChlD [Arthrobacter sp. AZCC_0090]|nr:Mg-chelatase subunit ChlD [Arthrobacter sp. AZCC_0090]
MALFGDPKFNAADTGSDIGFFDPYHDGIFGPRGTFSTSLDKFPYVFSTSFGLPKVWRDIIGAPVFSYCHGFDPVCNANSLVSSIANVTTYARSLSQIYGEITVTGNPAATHLSYKDAKDTLMAADRLAFAMNLTTPKPTSSTPIDLVFVIDSTGSMGGEIAGVQNNVVQLANTISTTTSSYRLALVDYKDDPANGSAYQSRLDVPFTTDLTSFTTGVNSIIAAGGGDTPESMYSGVMTALNLPWRAGVKKAVIVIGDAPGKDPEPVTGNTLASVTAKAFAVDPAQVYSVPLRGDPAAVSFMTALSQATGGTVTQAATTSDFITSLKSVIVQAGNAPVAGLTLPISATVGSPVKLSAAGTSSNPDDPVVAYDWNFGTGTPSGSYDQTTTSPIVSTTFTSAGPRDIKLRTRTASGLSGLATGTLQVTATPQAIPGAPLNLRALPGDGQVTLNWTAPSNHSANYYIVENGAGTALLAVLPSAPGQTALTWQATGLVKGAPQTYRVLAGNESGVSQGAGPITVTPIAAPTTHDDNDDAHHDNDDAHHGGHRWN